jgi:hypothetical protein
MICSPLAAKLARSAIEQKAIDKDSIEAARPSLRIESVVSESMVFGWARFRRLRG